jgi:uncharacterized protein (DUF302 family)
MSTELSPQLATRFHDAVGRTREALTQNGFGVLTEIDVRAASKSKLGVDMKDYLILGARNSALTYQAISENREIGLLLPCNVLVRADPGDPRRVIVEAMNPGMLLEITGDLALKAIADEVTKKLCPAIASLGPAV